MSSHRLTKLIPMGALLLFAGVLPLAAHHSFAAEFDADKPITLTGICERVDSIRIDRIQDARSRRLPFQQKIGAGLTRAEFNRRVDTGAVRHVGLTESVTMIADAMGWTLDSIADTIRPKIATCPPVSSTPRSRASARTSNRPVSGSSSGRWVPASISRGRIA